MEAANSPWCFQPLVVEKRINPTFDTSTLPIEDRWRAVYDYRLLSSATEPNTWPIPIVSEVVEHASAANWWSKWDIKAAFFQIELEEPSRPLTAFQTIDGIFRFTRMPQGLMGSPSTWSRAVDLAFGDLQCVSKSFDNCLTCNLGSAHLHLTHIESTLERLRKYRLRVNPAKTIFFTAKTTSTAYALERLLPPNANADVLSPNPPDIDCLEEAGFDDPFDLSLSTMELASVSRRLPAATARQDPSVSRPPLTGVTQAPSTSRTTSLTTSATTCLTTCASTATAPLPTSHQTTTVPSPATT